MVTRSARASRVDGAGVGVSAWHNLGWLPPVDDVLYATLQGAEISASDARRIAGCRLNDRQVSRLARTARRRLAADADFATAFKPLRVALLTDCNLEFALDALFVAGLRRGMALDIRLVEYSDVLAQADDPESDLYRFAPQYIVYAHFGALLQSLVLNVEAQNAEQAAARLLTDARMVLEALARNTGAKVLVQTVPATQAELFGNSEGSQTGGLGAAVRSLNDELAALGSPLIDVARLAARVGIYSWFDDAKYHWGKIPFRFEWLPLYAERVVQKIAVGEGQIRKCLVLDLDNTLWGGVIGDDGLSGILLGNNSATGEAFLAGQRYYKSLANRGVLLAVCSKNDQRVAEMPFVEHPDMVLKLEDFAAFVANWHDKASNLRHLARQLNLGLESFVFLDDNPVERDLVRTELPEVAVPELPSDGASLYPRILEAANYFEADAFTVEDLRRRDDYLANARREQLAASATDMASYLRSLDMYFQFEPFRAVNDDRVAQLINRSNQFNLTTRRYDVAEVARIREDLGCFGFTVRLQDRFADAGLIAVLIARDADPACWEIDTWLMSCRVLGRRVEEATLLKLVEAARGQGVARLVGRYLPSGRNDMVREHYAKLGFVRTQSLDSGETVWSLELANVDCGEEALSALPFRYS